MLSIGQLLSLWMPIYKNAEELDAMESQLSASSVCFLLCNPTTIDVAISVYSYWDTLHALSGAKPDKYALAIKDALPVIKMAEAPWICRRIPILMYYGEQHDPAFTCGNCDVCFAADSGLPDTTSIMQDVERIRGLFEQRQFAPLTRTDLHKRLRHSRDGQRVVEYLVFKGILKELPHVNGYALNCRLIMVGSKFFRESISLLRISRTTDYRTDTPHQHARSASSAASKTSTAPEASTPSNQPQSEEAGHETQRTIL